MYEFAASEFSSQAMAFESWQAVSPETAMKLMKDKADYITAAVMTFGTAVVAVARDEEVIVLVNNPGLMRLLHYDGKKLTFNDTFDEFSTLMLQAEAWLKS